MDKCKRFPGDLAAVIQRGKVGPLIDPDLFIDLRRLAAIRGEKRDRLFCAVGSWRLEKWCLELRMRHITCIVGGLMRAANGRRPL